MEASQKLDILFGGMAMATSIVVNKGSREIEPLEPTIWFERLRSVGVRALALDGHSPEPLFRHLFHLSQLTPGPLKHLVSTQMSEESFEGLLDCEAYASAALALMGQGMDYRIASPIGGGKVTVALSLGSGPTIAEVTASCLASAFLLAYCKCICALADRAHFAPRLRGPFRQIERSEPQRPSSTH